MILTSFFNLVLLAVLFRRFTGKGWQTYHAADPVAEIDKTWRM